MVQTRIPKFGVDVPSSFSVEFTAGKPVAAVPGDVDKRLNKLELDSIRFQNEYTKLDYFSEIQARTDKTLAATCETVAEMKADWSQMVTIREFTSFEHSVSQRWEESHERLTKIERYITEMQAWCRRVEQNLTQVWLYTEYSRLVKTTRTQALFAYVGVTDVQTLATADVAQLHTQMSGAAHEYDIVEACPDIDDIQVMKGWSNQPPPAMKKVARKG